MSSQDWPCRAVSVSGRVGFPTIGALRRRDLTAGEYRTGVAPLGANWVGTSVGGLRVV